MSTEVLFEKMTYPRLAGETSIDSSEQATTRGYAAGYAAGARAAAADAELAAQQLASLDEARAFEARSSVLSALQALDSAAQRASLIARPVIADADAALAAAAIELAEALLGAELDNHESSARAALARALAVAPNDEVLVVRMNPADLELVGAETATLTSAKLVGDPELQRGDAVLETPVGTIDARLSTAIERARTILRGGAA